MSYHDHPPKSDNRTAARRALVKGTKLGGCLLFVALGAACAAPLSPMQAASGSALPKPDKNQEYKVKFPDEGRGKARYIVLTIGDDVAANCGKWKTQHFEFDSTEPLAEDQLRLKELAECLNQSAFIEHDVMLRGNTDERGSSTYNKELGLRRAERVKEILVSNGVAAARLQTSSSGAEAAVGEDPRYSYGYDRRVDIALLNVVHAPR